MRYLWGRFCLCDWLVGPKSWVYLYNRTAKTYTSLASKTLLDINNTIHIAQKDKMLRSGMSNLGQAMHPKILYAFLLSYVPNKTFLSKFLLLRYACDCVHTWLGESKGRDTDHRWRRRIGVGDVVSNDDRVHPMIKRTLISQHTEPLLWSDKIFSSIKRVV